MTRLASVLALALVMGGCGGGQAPAPDSTANTAPPAASDGAGGPVVLSGFTLIDGNGGTPVPNSALVIEGGRITFVGPAAELKAPAGAATQDLSGKFLLPGLIDLHVHVAESDGAVQDPKRTFTRENVEKDLHLYASYGVTSVLSMGSDQPLVWDVRDEQHRDRPKVARIFTAGRGFTGKAAFPTNQGNIPGVPYEVSDPKQAAGFVDELAEHHPDVVKIWVDDRFGDFAEAKTPLDLSKAIIDEAHKKNLKVAAHVFYLDDAKGLAKAGLNAFAHSVRDKLVDDELIGMMKQHGTWQIATLTRDSTPFEFEHPEPFLNDPFFTKAAPPLFLERLKSPEYLKAMVADKHWSQYPPVLDRAKRNLKRLADAGVRYGFGTDAGVPGRVPAYLAHEELLLMRDAGLTPMQILVAATKSSAEFLGATDLGTVERGKWADLLVLNADPLADLRNSRQIHSVYVAGNKVN